MTLRNILIADDEPLIRNFLKDALKKHNFNIELAKNGQEAIDLINKHFFDLIITDIKMPKKSGLDILKFVKNEKLKSLVIFMTAFASVENAVEAMRLGAFNYLIKPFSFDAIESLLNKAKEHLALVNENISLKNQIAISTKQTVIAKSPSMQKLLLDIEKIAKSNASVFITGESGTGKEVIAQAIHNLSQRNSLPFIKVNCAAIPDTLIESEFFGHEKGAFTGADMKKLGRFELADKGSILLDEVSEIPILLQPKLLRAIQEQEFERVGGIQPIRVDIRFISTTNRNMQEMISLQHFREDLFYRLNVMPINIPALRERKEDIIALSEHFLELFCIENHKPLKIFSSTAKEKLLNYPWPGNVRELANIIERTVVMDLAQEIKASHLYLDYCIIPTNHSSKYQGKTLFEIEKQTILQTLKANNNNKTKAAKILGVSIRTLRNKMKIYNS